FCVSAVRLVEYLASGDAVRFILGIMSGIKPAVAIQFPFFACIPRQHTTFDRAEVAADQHEPGCCADRRSGTVTDYGERPRIPGSDVLIISGRNCSYCSIEIINNGAL